MRVEIDIPKSDSCVIKQFSKSAVASNLYPSLSLKHESKPVWNDSESKYNILKVPHEDSLVRKGQRPEAKITSFEMDTTTATNTAAAAAAAAPAAAPVDSTDLSKEDIENIVQSLSGSDPRNLSVFAHVCERAQKADAQRSELEHTTKLNEGLLEQVRKLEADKRDNLIELLDKAHEHIYGGGGGGGDGQKGETSEHTDRVRERLQSSGYTTEADPAFLSSLKLISAASDRIKSLEGLHAAKQSEANFALQVDAQTAGRRKAINGASGNLETIRGALSGPPSTPFEPAPAPAGGCSLKRSPFFEPGDEVGVFDTIMRMGNTAAGNGKRARRV